MSGYLTDDFKKNYGITAVSPEEILSQ